MDFTFISLKNSWLRPWKVLCSYRGRANVIGWSPLLYDMSDIDKGTFFYLQEKSSRKLRVEKSYRRVWRVIQVCRANIYSCNIFSRFKAKVTFSRLVILDWCPKNLRSPSPKGFASNFFAIRGMNRVFCTYFKCEDRTYTAIIRYIRVVAPWIRSLGQCFH